MAGTVPGELTVSFRISDIGAISDRKEIYAELYKGLTENISEDDVAGIQIYPARWPRKVQIVLKNQAVKDRLLVEGIDLNGRHVDVKDENTAIVKVIVNDAPIEWPNSKIAWAFERFGDIARIENEMIYVDGRMTSWTTGTRHVFFSKLQAEIPHRVSVSDGEQEISLNVWYRRHTAEREFKVSRCRRCGSHDHSDDSCPLPQKACFLCHAVDHLISACPQNDGSKKSDDAVVFLSSKSVLSNFNMDCPISVDKTDYNSTEQYIQSEKAMLFGDTETAAYIMKESDPRVMKRLGNKVKNYDDFVWDISCSEIVTKATKAKFTTHEKARQALLDTGSRMIGEGSRSKRWGIGHHISEEGVLDTATWTGKNLMGKILMSLREELREAAKPISSEFTDSGGVSENGSVKDWSESDMNAQIYEPMMEERNSVAVVIGDSNVRECPIENVPLQVVKVAVGGTKVQNVAERIDLVTADKSAVKVVVTHVGTCNWGITDGLVSADAVYREYIEALSSVSTRFPNAEIVISSVPPRVKDIADVTAEQCNNEIRVLNDMLRKLSTDETNVMFIDNDSGLTHENKPCRDLFRENDISGVHLNRRGVMILSDNIQQGIREACYKASLRDRWNVVPTSKPK